MEVRKNIILVFILSLLSMGCSKEKRSNKAAEKMKKFVIDIARYARSFDSDFIIIPQNGVELAFNELNKDSGIDEEYVSAVDGFGVEELYYNGDYSPDEYRIEFLQSLPSDKVVLVSEVVNDSADISDAVHKVTANGWLCFPRTKDNYYYDYIPDSVIEENNDDIQTLGDAKNYLYLIGNSDFSSKQEMLDVIRNTNFDLIIMDLFFNEEAFSKNEISSLKVKANGGKRLVIAYINIGAAENWRYYWKEDWKLHHPSWLKKPYEGYEDEIWVKYWKKDWQEIIYGNDNSYMKRIIDSGFDGAYLDNVEAYYFLYYD
ncbi:MAG: hypothetical protein D6707_07690 [Bacteroidetes bacterium]|nr:MAG: hypothetical protein D6707_07690 [Bacteroidota bacterium]